MLKSNIRNVEWPDRVADAMGWVEVAGADAIPPGTCRALRAGFETVLVTRIGEDWFASEAMCPHKGGNLEEGTLIGDRLRCPVHEASFDLATGASDATWAPPLRVFPVRVRDGVVEVQIE